MSTGGAVLLGMLIGVAIGAAVVYVIFVWAGRGMR
jgi:hypothetical protein